MKSKHDTLVDSALDGVLEMKSVLISTEHNFSKKFKLVGVCASKIDLNEVDYEVRKSLKKTSGSTTSFCITYFTCTLLVNFIFMLSCFFIKVHLFI